MIIVALALQQSCHQLRELSRFVGSASFTIVDWLEFAESECRCGHGSFGSAFRVTAHFLCLFIPNFKLLIIADGKSFGQFVRLEHTLTDKRFHLNQHSSSSPTIRS